MPNPNWEELERDDEGNVVGNLYERLTSGQRICTTVRFNARGETYYALHIHVVRYIEGSAFAPRIRAMMDAHFHRLRYTLIHLENTHRTLIIIQASIPNGIIIRIIDDIIKVLREDPIAYGVEEVSLEPVNPVSFS